MTFSELKKKDIICIGDGRLVGRACDLAIDPASGQTLGLIVCAGSCGFLRGEKKPDGNSVAADYVHRRRRDSGFAGKLLKKVYLFPECGYNERMKKAKIFKKRGKST